MLPPKSWGVMLVVSFVPSNRRLELGSEIPQY